MKYFSTLMKKANSKKIDRKVLMLRLNTAREDAERLKKKYYNAVLNHSKSEVLYKKLVLTNCIIMNIEAQFNY